MPCATAHRYGYCFAVSSCDEIPSSGGDPYKVKDYLVGMSLDTGKVVSETPICSLEPSKNATVDAPCPWSVEVA